MAAPIHAHAHAHAHLTKSMLDRLRQRLEAELGERRAASAVADGDDVYREVAEHVAAGNVQALADVEHALSRLADGTYGTCERCALPIPFERLEAMPAARLCVGCPSHDHTGLFG
jgi:RNA polymerase-binding transcription factor DksA